VNRSGPEAGAMEHSSPRSRRTLLRNQFMTILHVKCDVPHTSLVAEPLTCADSEPRVRVMNITADSAPPAALAELDSRKILI
jgi:hypothetical protein